MKEIKEARVDMAIVDSADLENKIIKLKTQRAKSKDPLEIRELDENISNARKKNEALVASTNELLAKRKVDAEVKKTEGDLLDNEFKILAQTQEPGEVGEKAKKMLNLYYEKKGELELKKERNNPEYQRLKAIKLDLVSKNLDKDMLEETQREYSSLLGKITKNGKLIPTDSTAYKELLKIDPRIDTARTGYLYSQDPVAFGKYLANNMPNLVSPEKMKEFSVRRNQIDRFALGIAADPSPAAPTVATQPPSPIRDNILTPKAADAYVNDPKVTPQTAGAYRNTLGPTDQKTFDNAIKRSGEKKPPGPPIPPPTTKDRVQRAIIEEEYANKEGILGPHKGQIDFISSAAKSISNAYMGLKTEADTQYAERYAKELKRSGKYTDKQIVEMTKKKYPNVF
jgi:hypothetical protein